MMQTDILDRLRIDPGQRTLGQLLQDREAAAREIRKLQAEIERLRTVRVSKKTGAEASAKAATIDRGFRAGALIRIAMNTIVVLEIFHLFFIRNIHDTSLTWAAAKGTRIVWICVIAVTAAQFAVTYLPPLQTVFGTQGVPLFDGLLIVVIGVVFFALIETEKQMRLVFRHSRSDQGSQVA